MTHHMGLTIQALPLLALVALLATGRVGPLASCAVALALSLPAALVTLPGVSALPGFAVASLAQGLWLALVPVGIITAGLVFHAAVSAAAPQAGTQAEADPIGTIFTAAFLMGPFAETITGFGVGAVFAAGALRRVGLAGAPVACLALISQTLIPWGGLGPGTLIGAALAGVPAQALASRNAWLLAALLAMLLPLFWHWCAQAGHPVPARRRGGQAGWVAAIGALLILLHHVAPWEFCGFLATGLLLAVRLLLRLRPRGVEPWLAVLRVASPYLLLATVLLASRAWRDPPALRPYAELPALPLTHAVVALWLVALLLVAMRPRPFHLLATGFRRALRPAAALLMFVLLARLLANAGVPTALAMALVGSFGAAAPYAAPLLAGITGFFAGSNVGANSAMMPLQAAIGHAAGLGPLVLPAVQNGSPLLLISPQLAAVASGLAGGGASPSSVWRHTWPIVPAALLIGMASIALG